MAHLVVDRSAQTVTVDLSAVEKVESLHRDLVVPLAAVASVRITARALGEVFGLRLPGTELPGLEVVGTFLSKDLGRTFAVCHGRGHGVVLELHPNETGYDRVVATVDDPEAVAGSLRHR